MRIVTYQVSPPIPTRSHDWCAVDDDTYDGGATIGWGRTREAAVENLKSKLDACYCPHDGNRFRDDGRCPTPNCEAVFK